MSGDSIPIFTPCLLFENQDLKGKERKTTPFQAYFSSFLSKR